MSKISDKTVLIKYRYDQAKETVEEVKIHISNLLFKTALNRMYYGMFYLLLALSLKYDFKTSKHNQLIGWFNKTFIKTGIISGKYGKIINKAYENRTEADYGILFKIEKEEIELRYKEMQEFISEIAKLLFP
jgi:uncharacterized protein (UPF0332 family)